MMTGFSLICYKKCDLLTLLCVGYGMGEPWWQVLKEQRNIKITTIDYIFSPSKLASYFWQTRVSGILDKGEGVRNAL